MMEQLENLVRIGNLHREAPNQEEFEGMLIAAKQALVDVKITGLSQDGQFTLVYGAAHGIARAALRWHGYRSDSRYIVFQCLQHTTGLPVEKWKVLDLCHRRRSLVEYEGHLEIDQQPLQELIVIADELAVEVEALGPVPG